VKGQLHADKTLQNRLAGLDEFPLRVS